MNHNFSSMKYNNTMSVKEYLESHLTIRRPYNNIYQQTAMYPKPDPYPYPYTIDQRPSLSYRYAKPSPKYYIFNTKDSITRIETNKNPVRGRIVYSRSTLLEISKSPLCEKPELAPEGLEEFQDFLPKGPLPNKLEDSKNDGASKENVYLPPYMKLIQYKSSNKYFHTLRRSFKSILDDMTPEESNICFFKIKSLLTTLDIKFTSMLECIKCLVKEIFSKAKENERCRMRCATLCNQIVVFEDQNKTNWGFRFFLNSRCKNMFQMPLKKQLKIIREQWTQKIIESKYEELSKIYIDNMDKILEETKTNYYGDIRFVADLYKLNILKPAIINTCITVLISSYKDGASVISLLDLLESCGKKFNDEHSDKMEKYISNISRVLIMKPLQPAIKNILCRVMELSKCDWLPMALETKVIIKESDRENIDKEHLSRESADESKSQTRRQRRKNRINNQICEDLVETTKYLELTVIDPLSVVTVEGLNVNDWCIGEKVEFRLALSYQKYRGSLQWTGSMNKILVAVIRVDNIASNDSLRAYLCPVKILEECQLSLDDGDSVIVLLVAVNKENMSHEYLQKIFGSSNDSNLVMDLLMDIVNNNDTRLNDTIIKDWNRPIDLTHYPDLLPRLINQHKYDVIAVLLSSVIASEKDNLQLMNIAKYFLLQRDWATFVEALRHCRDVNYVDDNGETFLTTIIKETKDEEMVERIVGTHMFDINKANNDGDTPLVLVCRQLMASSVIVLVANGASVEYRNNMALHTVMEVRKNIVKSDVGDTQILNNILEIVDVLTKNIRPNNDAL